MDALIKALKDFIFRDIFYVIGGVSVIFSILYAFGKMDVIGEKPSTLIVLYIAGIGYVLGWIIQTSFSVFRFITTSQSYRPIKYSLIRLLYRGFMHESLPKVDPFDQDEYSDKINEKAKPRSIAESDRITNHLQICTTIGPCAFVTGFILLVFRIDFVMHRFSAVGTTCLPKGFDICIILIGLILMLLARVMILRLTDGIY